MPVEVNKAAPAIWAAESAISAPIRTVWQVLSDFEGWPRWNKSVSKIKLDGPIRAGTSFVWVADGSKIVSRIEEVSEPHELAWSGTIWGIRAVHVWKLEEREGGTLVHTEESFDGLIAKLFPGVMRKMIRKALNQVLTALKIESESRNEQKV